MNTIVYSILKSTEGGPIKKELLAALRAEGIKCASAQSVYVGHTAIEVQGDKRVQRKAERIIFGK